MTPLIILGTGGSAYDVLDIIDAINATTPTWQLVGFLDDARAVGTQFQEWPVLGKLVDASKFKGGQFINVIGSDQSFRKRPSILASTGLSLEDFATIVHPGAGVSKRATLGRGVYVNFGVSLAGAVNIGNHVALGPSCIVGHDCQIGDYTLVAPGAVLSGHVQVGCCAYIGSGSVVKQRLRIGDEALVGMGAVVTRDVPSSAVVRGNPARQHRASANENTSAGVGTLS